MSRHVSTVADGPRTPVVLRPEVFVRSERHGIVPHSGDLETLGHREASREYREHREYVSSPVQLAATVLVSFTVRIQQLLDRVIGKNENADRFRHLSAVSALHVPQPVLRFALV
jgi:hypothetical protein